MPKKKAAKAVIDETPLNDTVLITNQISEEDEICREMIEKCLNSAMDTVNTNIKDAIERKNASTDILNGFIYFGKWCYMNKDSMNPNESFEQETIPKRLITDSWATNIIPIRKIIQKKEEIFEMKSNSKTNSVRSGQSNRSRISRTSLRSKLKKNPIDIELKKPLTNIMDENSEHDELGKVEIIQLNNNQNNTNISKQNKRKKRKLSKIKQNNTNLLSINLNSKNKNGNKYKQSMNIQLKTTRLSMNSSNAYKYHPNKPFTFDHTGQKMCVNQMKPEKIPNNIVNPLISFEDNITNEIDIKKDKKLKTKLLTRGMSASRKHRKKSNCKKSKEEPIFKTNSVPVQPPIESIIKISSGVSLKTNNATIKGIEKKKNKIENLSRSEYNQYIQTLKHLTKTHVFDTSKGNNNINNNENRDTNIENERNCNTSINTQQKQINPIINNKLRNGSPKSHRSPLNQIQRMKMNKSPKSIKYKRGLMSQQTDRLISPYNKNTLLPKINNNNSSGSSMDLVSKFGRNNIINNKRKSNKYQRKFVVESPKSNIEKSKLGKALFGSK